MSVRPASIIAFADVFKLHRAYAHTNPMVEEGELVPNGTPRSREIMGKPQENTIEFSDGVLVEIMAADGEFTHLILEFLDGLLADGSATAGEVEAQEIEALNKVSNSCFVGG